MARADLLVGLVQAGSAGDRARFRQTVEALIAEERHKQHHVLADQLTRSLANGQEQAPVAQAGALHADLAFEIVPHRSLESLYLPPQVVRNVVELVEEHHRADLLRSTAWNPVTAFFWSANRATGRPRSPRPWRSSPWCRWSSCVTRA